MTTKNKKASYDAPEVKFYFFEPAGLICTSGGGGEDPDPGEELTEFFPFFF